MKAEIDIQNILSVDLHISKQQLNFINESKKSMIPKIKTLILCGRQSLVVCSLKNSGRITSEEPHIYDDHFKPLLR